MMLTVLTPDEKLFEGSVSKIVAEATNGSFGILERHIDIVAPLAAGVLVFDRIDGETGFAGVDEGVLVKCGGEVSVIVRQAVLGDDLAELRRMVSETFLAFDEHERATRGALARLEAGVIRRLLELEQRA